MLSTSLATNVSTLQMLLMLILSRAWLALMPGLAGAASLSQARLRGAAGHQEIVSVALHEGAQGLNFDLFHPQLPQITAKV